MAGAVNEATSENTVSYPELYSKTSIFLEAGQLKFC